MAPLSRNLLFVKLLQRVQIWSQLQSWTFSYSKIGREELPLNVGKCRMLPLQLKALRLPIPTKTNSFPHVVMIWVSRLFIKRLSIPQPNTMYISSLWNCISGFDNWMHSQFEFSSDVTVKVRICSGSLWSLSLKVTYILGVSKRSSKEYKMIFLVPNMNHLKSSVKEFTLNTQRKLWSDL